jgi:hypothetical protein
MVQSGRLHRHPCSRRVVLFDWRLGVPWRHACVSAVTASCGHVKPSRWACFETHMDHLSGKCASRMTQVAEIAKECEGDVKILCGGVHRAAEALDCIKPRLSEVSKRCKNALAKVAVPFAFLQ